MNMVAVGAICTSTMIIAFSCLTYWGGDPRRIDVLFVELTELKGQAY